MKIAPLTAADIPAVIAVARATWPVSYAGVLTPEQIANMLVTIYTPENLAREMAQGHRFFAAQEGDAMLGFASAYREGDIAWLRKLYVLPQAQGRGIGRVLMEAALAAFAPVAEHRLLVNRHNDPARRFYAKHGFAPVGEVPVTMGDFAFVDFIYARDAAMAASGMANAACAP